MKKVCWFLIIVLLLGCFAGCQAAPIVPDQPTEPRSIENPDGTLADWMKEEMANVYSRMYDGQLKMHRWWDPETPLNDGLMYYGTYNGYVMFCSETGMMAYTTKEIAGYTFTFGNIPKFNAYKDGEFYDLEDLLEQGLVDEEAIRIAHEHYTEINKIKKAYREQQEATRD